MTLRKRLIFWISLWAAVSAAAVSLQLTTRQGGGSRGPVADALVPLANALHLASVPVRSTIRKAGLERSLPPAVLSAVAVSAGWLLLVGLAAGINEGRLALVRRSVRPVEDGVPVDLARRRFLINAGCGAAGFSATTAAAKAAVVDPGDIVVRRYAVPIRDLPPALVGLRIVQISDTHLGPAVSASHVRRAVDMTLALKPDLVVLTGDYIEAGDSFIQPAADLFMPLLARGGPPLGVLAVLGNHDFYGDAAVLRSALERVGVRLIDNTRVFLDANTRTWRDQPPPGATGGLSASATPTPPPAPAGAALCFAGLGDLDMDRTDADAAFRGVPDHMPRILLCHQPDTVEHQDARRHRADLALCGHTHGGQISLPIIGPPVIPSQFGLKYAGGLNQGPQGPVITSRGIGMSVLPVRWNVPPEVVEATLNASDGRRA